MPIALRISGLRGTVIFCIAVAFTSMIQSIQGIERGMSWG